MHAGFERRSRIERARAALERDSYPRLQMFLLVALTGCAGFLASWSLRRAGLDTMWLRYLLAIGCAYLIFLGLLAAWLRTSARDYEDAPEDALDGADALSDMGDGASVAGEGAAAAGEASASAAGEAAGALEALPLLALIALGALLLSALFLVVSVVSAAPLLFAELLIDGALSASLYRRLRGVDRKHWLESAVRRTCKPFLLVAVLLVFAGALMAWTMPAAHSVGEFIVAWRARA
jgi:hypothetical protein